MTLAAGTRLGAYEIIEPLAAGGMGEVYKARHATLDRSVAVKVLPPLLAANADARARFEREAKAVAALSHPNILAIHDFGIDAPTGTSYAVTELLEGQTLRQRLAGGPLPLKKAAEIARDVALGLAAAHDAGLVHRDIKPENIFLTAAGHVKILDFGLARPARVTSDDDPNSPTILGKTDPGTVMGTVGYMSPEQVRGVPADDRSDIFSLGCVLFEMVTGHRAFARTTAAETMTAILREDPTDVTRAEGPVPVVLEHVIRHCLEKESAERFQSAQDLAFALQTLSGLPTASGRSVALPVRETWRRWPALAVLLAVLVGVPLAWQRVSRGGALRAPQIYTFQQLTDQEGVETSPTLSPDGKTLVYVSDAGGHDAIYSVPVGARSATPLTQDSTADDDQPAFSPDGERIAFRSSRDGGGIFLMDANGESVRRLTDFGFYPSWSPDGREIVVSPGTFQYPTDRATSGGGLVAVDVATGAKRIILERDDAMQASWSPHGSRIAYWGLRGNSGQRDLWTVAADGSEAKHGGTSVTNDGPVDWSPIWSPDGRYLYFSSDRGGTMNLWRVAIDERSGRADSEPEPVTAPSTYSGWLSFSRDGSRLAFGALEWRSTLFQAAIDPVREAIVGQPTPILKSTRPIRDHQLSPDGKWVVYNQTSPQEDLIVARTDSSQYRRLTDDHFRNRGAAWSPDAQRLAFYSDRSGTYDIWILHPDGSGLRRLTDLGQLNFPVWSPNGRQLAVSGAGAPGWYIIDADRPAPMPRPEPPFDQSHAFWPASWSTSDQIVGALFTGDATVADTAVYSLATHAYHLVPGATSAGWSLETWLGDTGRLLFRDSHGIFIVQPDTGARRLLIPVHGYAVGRSVGVSRDGRRITYTETGTEGDIWLATLRK